MVQLETLVSEIAHTINDLPLALGNITSQLENMGSTNSKSIMPQKK